ncbi:PPE domain-containing protein [Actinokineospora auranticolor]|uniref:PPE family protein n=1 Tax=Actinokineospora auranticolor TaxID=155976 RepID=A0A2S6GH14_9PSEU|nr:PPE domain-containing protein [Actinokineospora auranticolor]PPK64490.1 PPE family protein [Actinokineospora auranticolor]
MVDRRYSQNRRHEFFTDNHDPGASAARKIEANRQARAENLAAGFEQINWNAYEHRVLYDMVMAADPNRMDQQAQRWSELAKRIDGTTSDVRDILQGTLGSWRGPAAVRAAEANTRLAQWAGEAAHKAGQVGEGLSNYTEAVSYAQRNMPEPVFSYGEAWFMRGYDVKITDGPSGAVFLKQLSDDHQGTVVEREAAKARAVEVMREYASSSQQVHDRLPEFSSGPTTTRPGAPVTFRETPTAPTEKTPGGDDPRPPRPPVIIIDGPPRDPDDDPHDPYDPPYPPPGDGTSTSGTPGYVPGTNQPTTNYPGTNYGPGGSGGGYASGGYGVGGGFGPGSGAGQRGGGALSGSGMAARGSAAFAAEAMAGRNGAAGNSSLYPPMGGAGANREEDEEHKNKYDDGLDLFDDLPPAYPSVFGA